MFISNSKLKLARKINVNIYDNKSKSAMIYNTETKAIANNFKLNGDNHIL